MSTVQFGPAGGPPGAGQPVGLARNGPPTSCTWRRAWRYKRSRVVSQYARLWPSRAAVGAAGPTNTSNADAATRAGDVQGCAVAAGRRQQRAYASGRRHHQHPVLFGASAWALDNLR